MIGGTLVFLNKFCVDYGANRALRPLDLRIGAGEKIGVAGASGSGKTTLLLHLNGTLRPRAGQVLLDGKPAGYGRAELTAWRRRVGLVLQNADDQLFAASVGEDVSFGPLNLGLSETEAALRLAPAVMTIGAGGAAMQALNAAKAGKVTIRLLKTSPVNAQLSALYNFQHEAGAAAWGQNVLTITDIARGDTYVCVQGSFVKFPDNTYNKNGNSLDWEFEFGEVDPLLGAGLAG